MTDLLSKFKEWLGTELSQLYSAESISEIPHPRLRVTGISRPKHPLDTRTGGLDLQADLR